MMKILSIPLIILSFLLCVSAQENSGGKWTRVETENKEISAAFPPNFIVDAEKRDYNQIYRIIGYQNGVNMEMKIFKDKGAETTIKGIWFYEGESSNFTSNGLKGKKATSFEKDFFSESIYLASEDYLYFFTVYAASNQKEEVKRFLFSIKINGKPIYMQKDKIDFPEENVSIQTLSTNPEVIEGFSRKYEKQKINVSNKMLSEFVAVEDSGKDVRPPIVLDKPSISFRQKTGGNVGATKTYKARLKVNFLANGQVGDIIAYSDDRGILVNSEDDKAFVTAC
jgi:hypothetical protein